MNEDSHEHSRNNSNDNNNNNSGNNCNNGMIGDLTVDIDLTLDLQTSSMSATEISTELFNYNNKSRNLRLATPSIWVAWFGGSFNVTADLVDNKRLGRRYTLTLAGIILSLLMFMFIFAQNETPVAISCLIEFFVKYILLD